MSAWPSSRLTNQWQHVSLVAAVDLWSGLVSTVQLTQALFVIWFSTLVCSVSSPNGSDMSTIVTLSTTIWGSSSFSGASPRTGMSLSNGFTLTFDLLLGRRDAVMAEAEQRRCHRQVASSRDVIGDVDDKAVHLPCIWRQAKPSSHLRLAAPREALTICARRFLLFDGRARITQSIWTSQRSHLTQTHLRNICAFSEDLTVHQDWKLSSLESLDDLSPFLGTGVGGD